MMWPQNAELPLGKIDLRNIFSYNPFIDIGFETRKYKIKTANNYLELAKVLKFRKRVFELEFGSCPNWLGYDIDRFDREADHLIILDVESDEVVGTYRLLNTLRSHRFYSENEFEINQFMALPGVKLELGRACVHPKYRNGAVLQLLWRGLMTYAKRIEADYLFGCASQPGISFSVHCSVLAHLKMKGQHNSYLGVKPTCQFSFREDERVYDSRLVTDNDKRLKEILPPLLQFYLKSGAQVYGEAAVDREFNCLDYFTVLQMKKLKGQVAERF